MASQTDRESAAAAMERINRAWLDRRPAVLPALFHPDLIMVLPGFVGRVEGRETLVAGFEDFCTPRHHRGLPREQSAGRCGRGYGGRELRLSNDLRKARPAKQSDGPRPVGLRAAPRRLARGLADHAQSAGAARLTHLMTSASSLGLPAASRTAAKDVDPATGWSGARIIALSC